MRDVFRIYPVETDSFGVVTGDLPTISGGPNMANFGNPFDVEASRFGLLGIDNVPAGDTVSLSVYVEFSNTATAPINESFTDFFAPFFGERPDLTLSEDPIVAVLQIPIPLDSNTANDNGQIIYQFRDYVSMAQTGERSYLLSTRSE